MALDGNLNLIFETLLSLTSVGLATPQWWHNSDVQLYPDSVFTFQLDAEAPNAIFDSNC
jgi:hypothetical protein